MTWENYSRLVEASRQRPKWAPIELDTIEAAQVMLDWDWSLTRISRELQVDRSALAKHLRRHAEARSWARVSPPPLRWLQLRSRINVQLQDLGTAA